MVWPAYSPDFNPIENLWDALGRAVSSRFPPPATLIELETALQEEWPCEITHHPSPTEDEIQFILNEVKNYLTPEITGGKWTTYRVMAKEAVDAAVQKCNLKPKSDSQTDGLLLEGASGWTPNMYIRLVQDYGLESEVAKHLANTYGDRAFTVAKHASLTGKRWPIIGRRLHEEYPYIEAESIGKFKKDELLSIAEELKLVVPAEELKLVVPDNTKVLDLRELIQESEIYKNDKEMYQAIVHCVLEEINDRRNEDAKID
ncbi:glycerol-3-phosphate dehydrogenase, mitochondrial [Trichonephila clavipes]|nr:glycerol-3-phosphate dehydrogenase, mitochondrial [Trichonephila clavipes]